MSNRDMIEALRNSARQMFGVGSFEELNSPKPKLPPLWYVGLRFNRETMLVYNDILYGHDYYLLLEVLHTLNAKGDPFLFLTSHNSIEQQQKFQAWIYLCCRSEETVVDKCMNDVLPRLNKLCRKLRETNHDGTRFTDEEVHRGDHSEGSTSDPTEGSDSGTGMSLPCGGYETNPSGSD